MKYIVTSPGGREVEIEARNSTQAKRMACKCLGIKPSDKWCGASSLTAKKINDMEGRRCK